MLRTVLGAKAPLGFICSIIGLIYLGLCYGILAAKATYYAILGAQAQLPCSIVQ